MLNITKKAEKTLRVLKYGMAIAIFDSGAGGLTVLKTALRLLPQTNFIYFADTQNVPYGEKKTQEVKQHIKKAIDFLNNKNPDAIILACNTATSLMAKELRQQNYPFTILGMEPAVKLAVDSLKDNKDKKILITGTKITVEGQRLKDLLKRFNKQAQFESLALPKLVELIENKQLDSNLVEEYLAALIPNPEQYQAVVLGCTHFSFFKDEFKDFFPEDTLIFDGNLGTIKHLIKTLQLRENLSGERIGTINFYFSGKKDQQQEKYYRQLLAKLA